MDYPARQEDKLDLVTRYIRDIRRIARKLGEGGAPFAELQDLYELADVFQTVSRTVLTGRIDTREPRLFSLTASPRFFA
jgi:hypothetical protein